MDWNNEATKAIIDTIEQMFNRICMKLPYDRTFEGKISKVLANKTYEVFVNGEAYTLTSQQTYTVGQNVEVFVPENNYRRMRVL